MDAKKLRSSLKLSAEEFLTSATKFDLRTSKSILKTLIWGIPSSSSLVSSLPISLHLRVSQAVESFKKSLDPTHAKSPSPPPSKRPRRSSRNRKSTDEGSDGDLGPKLSSESKPLLKNLQTYSHIAHMCVSHPKKLFSPSDLLPSVQSLHDSLILYESDPVLMSKIASLCEEWWKEGLFGKETLISQSIPFLISKSLQSEKKVDLHRVYALREALCLFDFSDESIEDLKHLLIRCVVTSLYLKIEEGRRFVAFLFGLNLQLVKETLAVIRTQIPFGKKSILDAFGDILFRAWKAGDTSLREEIEDEFLQGLIEGAIYAKSGPLAASIRRIFGAFISQRTVDGVDKLLFRLVEPLLFRSLQVANSNVRQNALHVLLDMFPLEDPDATKEAKDTLLDKQFLLLDRLLVDDCPSIRLVAVEGSCRVLRLFWEVIPSLIITKLLSKIVDDMAHDVSNEVRLSTLNGIIYLLGNPQTHEILKVLLPRLRHMFHDTVLSVRVAVADLLLAVRDLRNFQFTKVVDSHALLSSLASDHPLLAKKITKLLITSYFPSKVTLEEACTRCVTLIRRSPTAGARFCEFALTEGSSPESLMELTTVCVGIALSPNNLISDQVGGFFIAAANLCKSLASEAPAKTFLAEFFSGEKLKHLLTLAPTSRARTSVLSICSIVSPENVAGLLELVMGLVTNCGDLFENLERQEEVRAAHRVMLSCGRFDDLFEALTNLLQAVARRCQTKVGLQMPKQSAKRKKIKLSSKNLMRLNKPNGKKSFFLEEDCLRAAGVAWQIKDLLMSEETRRAILDSPILEIAFTALKDISEQNIEQSVSGEFGDTSPVLAYTALAFHMSLQNVGHMGTEDVGDGNSNTSHSMDSSQQTTFNCALKHLILCTKKIFGPSDLDNSVDSPSKLKQREERKLGTRRSKRREVLTDITNPTKGDEQIPDFREGNRISNIVKMVTTILKIITDGAGKNFHSRNHEMVLQFTSTYFRYLIPTLAKHQDCSSLFSEENLREVFICLKSSITYAAKLLNIVFTNSTESSLPPPQISNLADDVLNLFASIELHLGLKHASFLVPAAKPWLPDLILGLGSHCVLGNATQKEAHSNHCVPTWLASLSEVELSELSSIGRDEQNDKEMDVFPSLKKLMGMVVTLLKKGDPSILDAIGVAILKSAVAGLEAGNFGLVLGLVHFVCVKLVGPDYGNCEEVGLTMNSVNEIYLQVEGYISNTRTGRDGRKKLERVKALLESTGMIHE